MEISFKEELRNVVVFLFKFLALLAVSWYRSLLRKLVIALFICINYSLKHFNCKAIYITLYILYKAIY